MEAQARRQSFSIAALLALSPAVLLAAEGGEEHPAVIVPPTVWAIASFLVVLFVLWKKLLPPIFAAMDKRAQDIRDSLDAAEKARADAEEAMRQHQSDLETARQEARAIIEEGKADAERVKNDIIESARKESEEIAARAQREITLAKQDALAELHKQSVDLSFGLAADLIGKSLNPDEHQELIQQRIRSFEGGD